ncbi:hypothetical protein SPSIL_001140 [Sporomusa silvacetica DSM 10669]|uniref:N-acetyltransferase domain-containing protein n=1 Tax=Sporomusa silvacetica DSM 10669 TaxID=1123289 RepID=A0ABZ3IEB1_9FIRM|nr:hypothetical protein [Sporomusa silvacetica]OZC22623.1 hypothetical protein SPSIL_05830 [Sporomusa silvacetica DSM 10669]
MIHIISKENSKAYYNLTQAYEAEFSKLTHEMPDEDGVFKIQTDIDHEHIGYLLYDQKKPIGFMVVCMGEVKDVSEFYIIPGKRMSGYGQRLASYVFTQHPGRWQVRQISGADSARAFWRKVIDKITAGNYLEEVVEDKDWGRVSRQSFEI